MTLDASREFCRQVARQRARNFYYSFLLLDREQRDAMCAVYAFMRECDDLSDEPGAERPALEQWRKALDAALEGQYGAWAGWPAFHDAASRYGIPKRYFHEMIEGVASDLEPRRVRTFDELYRYCYQVASVVGLTVIHIFGFESPRALDLAEKCGVAFQLTNILRDVEEDAARGRIYLPFEDMERFGVTEAALRAGRDVRDLLHFEAERARAYYAESRPLLGLVHPSSRASLWALMEIYSRLLGRITASGYDVFGRRIRLSALEKSWILVSARWRCGS